MRFVLIPALCLILASCNDGGSGAVKERSDAVAGTASGTHGVWLNGLLDAYYGVKLALVEADSSRADSMAVLLGRACDSATLPSADSATLIVMKSLLGDLSSECRGFQGETTLEARRRSFNMMGEHLYPLLQAAGYDGGQVYRQVCPMAFNDTEKASWLSDSREIVNPYLGKKHPKYSAGMLHCGELEDSLMKAR
jgi:hypothetical protein